MGIQEIKVEINRILERLNLENDANCALKKLEMIKTTLEKKCNINSSKSLTSGNVNVVAPALNHPSNVNLTPEQKRNIQKRFMNARSEYLNMYRKVKLYINGINKKTYRYNTLQTLAKQKYNQYKKVENNTNQNTKNGFKINNIKIKNVKNFLKIQNTPINNIPTFINSNASPTSNIHSNAQFTPLDHNQPFSNYNPKNNTGKLARWTTKRGEPAKGKITGELVNRSNGKKGIKLSNVKALEKNGRIFNNKSNTVSKLREEITITNKNYNSVPRNNFTSY